MASYLLFCFGLILVATTNIHSENIFSQRKEETIEFFKKYHLKNGAPLTPLRNLEHGKAPVVTLFYESMCPGCRKFDTTYFSKLVSKLGRYILIFTIPYGKAATTTYYNGTVTFWCQHGEPECYGNKLHGCAIGVLQQDDEIQPMLFNSCLMEFERPENGSNDDAIDECGTKMNIDVEKTNAIKQCAKSEEGSTILKTMGIESVKANYTSLPHVEINFEHWTGEHENLIKDVCIPLKNLPEPCKDV